MNYVFYVSDEMDAMPISQRLRKMDAGREVAEHIKMDMKKCTVLKYTEYTGETLEADSVGIIFPAHSWGISLAIYSFMQNLRVGRDTYVYAVAVGEHLERDMANHIKIIDQFKRIIDKKSLSKKSDIFVRCKGIKRDSFRQDYPVRRVADPQESKEVINTILDGLLYHSFDEINNKPHIEKQYNEFGLNYGYSLEKTGRTKAKLNNIYLDDSMFAGIRFSKVI
ncbi:MAG: hypothetical protein IJV15_00775 [Lachnospiraceae bacterium]|nr:hypothetical protein [Lachnospiraceae bacterium]